MHLEYKMRFSDDLPLTSSEKQGLIP